MKAEMSEDGVITIRPETGLEAYALKRWNENYHPEISGQQIGITSLLLVDVSIPTEEE